MKIAYMVFCLMITLAIASAAISCGDDDDDDDNDDADDGEPGCCYWAGDEGAVFDSDIAGDTDECVEMAEESVVNPDALAVEYVDENVNCEDDDLAPAWWG